MRILKSIIKATVLGVMLTACTQNTAPTGFVTLTALATFFFERST